MNERRNNRGTPAIAIALVALFVALGGSSYAAVKLNGSRLMNESVSGAKLKDRTIDRTKLVRDAVTTAEVRDASLRAADFRRGELPAGPRGPEGRPGTPGPEGRPGTPARGFYVTARDQTQLAAPADDLAVASLPSIPAGNYLLSGHTAAVNFASAFGYVRCGIRAAGSNSFGSSGLGSAAAVGTGSGFSTVGQIYVSLPVRSPSPFTADLVCRQTGGATGAYVEETRLMAVQLGELEAHGN